MKRLICLCIALGVSCTFAGRQGAGRIQAAVPLEAAAVTAALEETGLPGSIDEEETQSYAEGHIVYTLRGADEKTVMHINSVERQERRFLQIYYYTPSVPEGPAFAWEDWKRQLVFAALLFGGFSDQEEIYRAFAGQDVQAGKIPITDYMDAKFTAERYEWDARLPGGYCRIKYELANTSVESSSYGNRVLAQSPRMYIAVYESEAAYQKMRQEKIEAKEKADAARAAASTKKQTVYSRRISLRFH